MLRPLLEGLDDDPVLAGEGDLEPLVGLLAHHVREALLDVSDG